MVALAGFGVVESTDGGFSWELILASGTNNASAVACDQAGNIIVLGLDQQFSSDGGQVWAQATGASGGSRYQATFVSAGVAIAALGTGAGASATTDFLVSPDGGASWTTTASALPYEATHVAGTAGGVYFIAAFDGEVLRSSDGGVNWTEVVDLGVGGPSIGGELQGLVISSAGSVFAAATREIWRSTDGGSTWTEIPGSTFDLTGDSTAIMGVLGGTADGSRQLVVADGGIHVSSDDGVSWSSDTVAIYASGIEAIAEAAGAAIVTTGQGIWRYDLADGSLITSGLPAGAIARIELLDSGRVLGSKDVLGRTMVELASGDWLASGTGGLQPVEYLVLQSGRLLAASVDSFETLDGAPLLSDDSGVTWVVAPDGTQSIGGSLAQMPDGTIYLGNERGELYESTDDGDNWSLVVDGDTHSLVCFCVLLESNGELFFGSEQGFGVYSGGVPQQLVSFGLIRTWDLVELGAGRLALLGVKPSGDRSVFIGGRNGSNWVEVSTGFPDEPTRQLAVITGSHLLAQTDGPFYYLENGLPEWRQMTHSSIANSSALFFGVNGDDIAVFLDDGTVQIGSVTAVEVTP
jgi:hypothetical protein